MATATLDWRNIADEKEKYQAYLCSPEWGRLRAAVHERAGGVCERCKIWPIDAVHHVTYARKFREELEDLAGECKWCHEFTHGKGKWDPAACDKNISRYIQILLIPTKCPPVPASLHPSIGKQPHREISLVMQAIELLLLLSRKAKITSSFAGLSAEKVICDAIGALNVSLPFDYANAIDYGWQQWNVDDYLAAIEAAGLTLPSDTDIGISGEA